MSRARAAIVILGDAMLIVAVVLLLEIDKLVNGVLYNYGLVFSYDWAQPYWLIFRVSLVLIVVAVILISVVELPHPAFEARERETLQKVEQMTNHQPIAREESKTALASKGDMITCPKCNRLFSTPSVILDFSNEKPRLVNACPYCNHVLEYQKRIK